jgi:sec-independent protein translocase protein TatB
MFNIGFSELLILGVIALIFIGPNQLPEVARTIGRLLNEWKRATSDFQNTITTQITEEVSTRVNDARSEHQNLEPANPGESGHHDHSHLESGMGDQMIKDHEDQLPVGAHPVSEKDKKS